MLIFKKFFNKKKKDGAPKKKSGGMGDLGKTTKNKKKCGKQKK